MKKFTWQEIQTHAPADVPILFVPYRKTDDRTQKVLKIAAELTDEELNYERAIIFYGEGIKKEEAESITIEICELVELDDPEKPKRLFVETACNVPEKDIKVVEDAITKRSIATKKRLTRSKQNHAKRNNQTPRRSKRRNHKANR